MIHVDATVRDDDACVLCARPWIGCMCLAIVDELDVQLRRATESGDLETAAEISAEIEQRVAGRA